MERYIFWPVSVSWVVNCKRSGAAKTAIAMRHTAVGLEDIPNCGNYERWLIPTIDSRDGFLR